MIKKGKKIKKLKKMQHPLINVIFPEFQQISVFMCPT